MKKNYKYITIALVASMLLLGFGIDNIISAKAADEKSGLLLLEMQADSKKYNPLAVDQYASISYQPQSDGTEELKLTISGFSDSGLEVSGPEKKDSIKSVDKFADKVVITYNSGFSWKDSTNFIFTLKVKDEVKFTNKIIEEKGAAYFTGLKVEESVGGRTNQVANSKFELDYKLRTGGYGENDSDIQILKQFSDKVTTAYNYGMFLYTKGENVEAPNGGGWLSQESEYILMHSKARRPIANYKLEIPLPPGVKFVRSDYSAGKDGITITAGKEGYIILEYSQLEIPDNLKFSMTLDYTGLPSRVAGKEEDSIDDWHNFWRNGTLVARNQTGKPWKFSGKIFGIEQEKEFYERSTLALGTLTYSSNTGAFLGSFFPNLYTNSMLDVRLGVTTDEFDLLPNQQNNYMRNIYRFDEVFRVKSMDITKIYNANPLLKSLVVTFYTNKGREETISTVQSHFKPSFVLEKDEYINRVDVDTKGLQRANFDFIYDILDVDLKGNKLAYNTVSKIRNDVEVIGYGKVIYGNRTHEVKYLKPVVSEPMVEVSQVYWAQSSGGTSLYPYYRYLPDQSYNDINLIKIDNSVERSGKVLENIENLSTPKIEPTLKNSTENNFIYQMLTKSAVTLKLEGYKTSNLPEFKIYFETISGKHGEIVISKDDFTSSGGNYIYKFNFKLDKGDQIKSLAYDLSNLPISAKLNLSLDEMKLDKEFLPSGVEMKDLPLNGDLCDSIWYIAPSEYQFNIKGSTDILPSSIGESKAQLAWNYGIGFGDGSYLTNRTEVARKKVFAGEITQLKFGLADHAYNPTYAFEINKNFNYVEGTLKGIYKEYAMVEEWIPNFFTADNSDASRAGNGLLRVKFVGGNSETAYNLFPIKDSRSGSWLEDDDDYNQKYGEVFTIDFRVKNENKVGSYNLIEKIYRSDIWAQKNLVGKGKFEVDDAVQSGAGWDPWDRSFPESNPKYPYPDKLPIINKYIAGEYPTAKDKYDIDDDGNLDTLIVEQTASPYWNKDAIQEIVKQSSTNVNTYLVDSKGNEIVNARLYPHQKVDLIQTLRVVSDSNGSNYIGYYHIPKKGHNIVYKNLDGKENTYTSTFDTYLTNFISTKVNGVDVPTDKGMIVKYYISDDPTVINDGHNDMKELVDGVIDTDTHYKTEAEIRALAGNDDAIKALLAKCTMIKITATTIDANVDIVSKASLEIGHKEAGDKTEILDYFTGVYRYTAGGFRINKSYTPAMTMTMLPYNISGKVVYDKNADSIMSLLESGIKGVNIELWQTGKDPHDSTITLEDKIIQTTKSDENGAYSFTVSYHGEYYLKVLTPKDMQLSITNKGTDPVENSVFVKDKDKGFVSRLFELTDSSLRYQNAGFVDKRTLDVPTDIYISKGESRVLPYQIKPEYLMNEDPFKIKPKITSPSVNDEYFIVDNNTTKITGIKVGDKQITVSIPDAPDGTTFIEKTINIHIEPESVASVSVPSRAEIYAIKGKNNEVLAPILSIYNYSNTPIDAFVKNIAIENTGYRKHLKLKPNKNDYEIDEISLSAIPIMRENPFSGFIKTDVTTIGYGKGLKLGVLDKFLNTSNGQFTFDGQYNSNIELTELGDNKFVMSYKFTKVTP